MTKIMRTLRLLSVTPFETSVSVWLMVSGLTQVTDYGSQKPIEALLPTWEAASLAAMMILAGGLMIAGAGIPHRGALAAGCLFILAVMMCRFLVYGVYLGYGPDFVTSAVFDVTLIWAAVMKLLALYRHQAVVRVTVQPESPA